MTPSRYCQNPHNASLEVSCLQNDVYVLGWIFSLYHRMRYIRYLLVHSSIHLDICSWSIHLALQTKSKFFGVFALLWLQFCFCKSFWHISTFILVVFMPLTTLSLQSLFSGYHILKARQNEFNPFFWLEKVPW